MRLGFQSDKDLVSIIIISQPMVRGPLPFDLVSKKYLVKGKKENKKKSVIFSKQKKKAERLNYQYQVQSVNYEKIKNQEEMQRLM